VLFGYPETIDRIIAVVNDQVITLTDIRIVREFGLIEDNNKEKSVSDPSFILERLIDQELVVHLSREEIKIEIKEVESYLRKIKERMGEKKIQRKLEEFGLNLDDLKEYIRKKIFFEKIISRKFNQSVIVSLEEIESYYKKNYVPSQREKGLEPQPMIQVIHKIESVMRENKRKKQVKNWISNLRRQADIQIKIKNLNEYFKKSGRKYE
jgi:hypothetical protein